MQVASRSVRTGGTARVVGSGAGLLSGAIGIYALAAVVWALALPGYTARVVSEGNVQFDAGSNTAFSAFGWFVLLTGALSAAIGGTAFRHTPELRGPCGLVWVSTVAFIAAVGFVAVGNSLGQLLNQQAIAGAGVGETISVIPLVTPGIALVVAPLLAAVAFWTRAFVD